MTVLDKYEKRMSDYAIKTRTDLDKEEQDYLNALVREEVQKIKGKYRETVFLDAIAIELAKEAVGRRESRQQETLL
jgi:hypothetical protein